MVKGLWSLGFVFFLIQLCAQDVPKVSETYLIKGALVTATPESTPVIQDILIKDGIIQQVGPNINAPIMARIIRADSMYMYPGFIAAASHIGIAKPKDPSSPPKIDRPGYPPNDIAGITPEASSSDVYNEKDGSITTMRKMGFTISHSMPYGKMLPGQTAIISLNGKSFNEAVIAKDFGQYAQFKGASSMFPATTIGVIATWREMYRNAELANKHAKRYKQQARNLKRPNQDPATLALIPLTEGKQSVFFHAEEHVDIQRALQLQKELGFTEVIVEAKRGEMSIQKAKNQGVKMLISLDLPKVMKKDTTKDEMAKKDDKALLMERKQKAITKYEVSGTTISEAGLTVGFSLIEVKSKDVFPNIRRLIENGMSEQKALAHLTTFPAKLLSIDNIAGTLEKGKIANLVISKKPIFEKEAMITMVMVDGILHKMDTKKKSKKTSGKSINIEGKWSYKIDVPGIEPSGTIDFTKVEDAYNLSMTNSTTPGESYELTDQTMDGNSLSYSVDINVEGSDVNLEIEITFDGDAFEGSVDVGEFGNFPITGQKDGSPE